MARLSITTAWNETVAFVKAEGRLLFPLAFMAVALPAAAVRALVPVVPAGEAPPAGPWLAAAIVALILAAIGYLAISYLALRAGASVREALVRGATRMPLLIAAGILIGCGLVALAFLISIVVTLAVVGAAGGASAPPGTAEMGRVAGILLLILAPILLFVFARLLPLTPTVAVEAGGPFALLARSWRLTAGYSLKLMAFVAVLFALSLVLQIAVEAVFGSLFILTAGPAAPGSISSILTLLVMAALQTVLVAYLGTLVARIYAQLAADQPSKGS